MNNREVDRKSPRSWICGLVAADISAGQSLGIWGAPVEHCGAALVTGIVLGMWTSAYRSVGQPRDELRVREIRTPEPDGI